MRHFRVNHRRPPEPPWFRDTPKGNCRWCNEPIENRRRNQTWHPECAEQYKQIFWPEHIKRQALRRNSHCAVCGAPYAYEADHIVPLELVLPHGDDAWWPWRISNIQMLCGECHRRKTAAQRSFVAAARQAWRISPIVVGTSLPRIPPVGACHAARTR